MENKCSLSIRNIFLLAVSLFIGGSFPCSRLTTPSATGPAGGPVGAAVRGGDESDAAGLPAGYPRSGGKAQSARDPPELPARGLRPIPVDRSALMAKSKNNPDGRSIPLM
jgi:hypothetical protein